MTKNEYNKVVKLLALFVDFPKGTNDKRNILKLVCKYLESGKHKYFRSDSRYHAASTVGSFYMENKGHKRQGELLEFRGTKVIVMCIVSGTRRVRRYLAATIE